VATGVVAVKSGIDHRLRSALPDYSIFAFCLIIKPATDARGTKSIVNSLQDLIVKDIVIAKELDVNSQ
jgi:hypothetical protein